MHTISPQVEREFVSTYDQAINTGMEKGKLEGIKEGMQKGMQKVALSMLKEGSSDDFIIKITGFDIQQLSAMKKSINRK